MLCLELSIFVLKLIFAHTISSTGNQYNERKEQVDTKSYQWFGATVASAGIDGPLVVSNKTHFDSFITLFYRIPEFFYNVTTQN
jgi:hypothetical protein